MRPSPPPCPHCGTNVLLSEVVGRLCTACNKPLPLGYFDANVDVPRSSAFSNGQNRSTIGSPPTDTGFALGNFSAPGNWMGFRVGLELVYWALILSAILNFIEALAQLLLAKWLVEYASEVAIVRVAVLAILGITALIGTLTCCIIPSEAKAGKWVAALLFSGLGTIGLVVFYFVFIVPTITTARNPEMYREWALLLCGVVLGSIAMSSAFTMILYAAARCWRNDDLAEALLWNLVFWIALVLVSIACVYCAAAGVLYLNVHLAACLLIAWLGGLAWYIILLGQVRSLLHPGSNASENCDSFFAEPSDRVE